MPALRPATGVPLLQFLLGESPASPKTSPPSPTDSFNCDRKAVLLLGEPLLLDETPQQDCDQGLLVERFHRKSLLYRTIFGRFERGEQVEAVYFDDPYTVLYADEPTAERYRSRPSDFEPLELHADRSITQPTLEPRFADALNCSTSVDAAKR